MAKTEEQSNSEAPPSILVMGGTTEGRIAAEVCDGAARPFLYSTKEGDQAIQAAHATLLSGSLDAEAMTKLCRAQCVGLIVDAAHPFATKAHATIGQVAQQLGLTVIRLARPKQALPYPIHWVEHLEQVPVLLEELKVESALSLAGVKSIAPLRPYWQGHKLWVRIMDRKASWTTVETMRFPREQIVLYQEAHDDLAMFSKLKPGAIIVKESGASGGFSQKVTAAHKLGIPIIAWRCPELPYKPTSIVYGAWGLRHALDELLPGYFPLRIGYTSGTCATAATIAALRMLLGLPVQDKVTVELPSGEPISIPIECTEGINSQKARACVRKFAGDDPDVTDGHLFCSTVRLNDAHHQVRFLQGDGVGRVTLPGLGLEIGGPAINATPRRMMTESVTTLMAQYADEPTGVDVTISVPNGQELACKTFNPKLGIVDGISIIGTCGIVKPYSIEAYLDSIRREIAVAASVHPNWLVLNSGAKSLSFLKALYPDFPEVAFVQYGNFIGDTLTEANRLHFPHVSLGIMLGKAVKLAAGNLNTHSHTVVMDKEFLKNLAQQAGCSGASITLIDQLNTARQLWKELPEADVQPFVSAIAERCYTFCAPILENGMLHFYLLDEEGQARAVLPKEQ